MTLKEFYWLNCFFIFSATSFYVIYLIIYNPWLLLAHSPCWDLLIKHLFIFQPIQALQSYIVFSHDSFLLFRLIIFSLVLPSSLLLSWVNYNFKIFKSNTSANFFRRRSYSLFKSTQSARWLAFLFVITFVVILSKLSSYRQK